jgi:hypothetical protein
MIRKLFSSFIFKFLDPHFQLYFKWLASKKIFDYFDKSLRRFMGLVFFLFNNIVIITKISYINMFKEMNICWIQLSKKYQQCW